MTKIYTKTGDDGSTGLIGGKRVSKACVRICAYGDIDELNSLIGVCRHSSDDIKSFDKILKKIQEDLFVVGTELAGGKIVAINTKWVEGQIDSLTKKISPLKNFVLPSGCEAAGFLHLARTVCRRAERAVVFLNEKEQVTAGIIKYLNRLSDLLFVMARYANKTEKVSEEKWSGNN
jgi:cob(I)alamin adenosyltransferase